MEKVVLEVDLGDESHLRELIENHEVYGEALIKLIQHTYKESYATIFGYEDEEFILIS